MKNIFLIICFLITQVIDAQEKKSISGVISSDGVVLANADIKIIGTNYTASSDELGKYKIENIPAGNYKIQVSYFGNKTLRKNISIQSEDLDIDFELENDNNSLDVVVVSGTLKPVSRLESPVPVEVYKPTFFKKNPTANIFEALQNVNGVRPQLNCNICNTGDIHINGLEGPYTLVLIDGMPIVSGLSTVYGLSGIPNSLLERIEIVKGPASSLYGSEAVGGLINIITKNPSSAPRFSVDGFSNSWGEANLDLGFKAIIGDRKSVV